MKVFPEGVVADSSKYPKVPTLPPPPARVSLPLKGMVMVMRNYLYTVNPSAKIIK